MTAASALAGRKIIVTRPAHQNDTLCQLLRHCQAEPITFPLLEIQATLQQAQLHNIIQNLPGSDLVIFISPNAVHFGLQSIIKQLGELPTRPDIAAVGHNSAQQLLRHVNTVIYPPQQSDSESLLALPRLQQVYHQQVIVFRGNSGRELLKNTLEQRGAYVNYAECYQRHPTAKDIRPILQQQPDAIVVSSTEALNHLNTMITPHYQHNLLLACNHPRIQQQAQHSGWQHTLLCPDLNTGLIKRLQTYFAAAPIARHAE